MVRCLIASFAALVIAAVTLSLANSADATPTFTRPPPLPAPLLEGRVAHDGARIWFATFGSGAPVILLHGAGGDSDNFGLQVPALVADGHRVIVIDSRGQGRSTHDDRPLGYELMERDVIAVMDALGVPRADVVGWSDGAILSLIMAMKHPERVDRIYAFSPNMNTSAVAPDWMSKPEVTAAIAWAHDDYVRLSPTPKDFPWLMGAIARMTTSEPNYSAADLAAIRGPTIAIVDGDQEDLILPEHTRYLARTIPGARLILLKGVGHGAPIEDPEQFNKSMLAFLDQR